ncbi:LuxR family transcriptional regulator [Sphaerisporangium rufum]|uniref:LuxR family transcriptional regulator n=1 Tax=Sphaerisporangium rufum TaxID=1381558 RepID=A0A919R457_9ACTN|nr:cupin domain-containing protein [Sphaerisporangium rufum]GII76717.1 LuxR family transcriptional regulator [Sphaerisporangium rufum]
MEKFSLIATGRTVLERAAAGSAGHAAETVVGGHERELRQTVIGITAGGELGEHDNRGEATLQVLQGRVRLVAGDVSWDLLAGDLLIIPPARHRVEAVEDAVLLLSFAHSR